MKKNESKELLLSVFGVTLLIIAITGITYAIFNYVSVGTKENSIKTGSISMSYIESNTDIISINNAIPISDVIGKMQNEYFDFTINSAISGNANIKYDIYAKDIKVENQLDDDYVKLYLEEYKSFEYVEILEPTVFKNTNDKGMLLYSDNFLNDASKTKKFSKKYRFRMWLNENYKMENISKSFKIKINVYAGV